MNWRSEFKAPPIAERSVAMGASFFLCASAFVTSQARREAIFFNGQNFAMPTLGLQERPMHSPATRSHLRKRRRAPEFPAEFSMNLLPGQKKRLLVAALPGGNGNSGGSFNNAGNNASNAYNRNMNYNNENVNKNNNDKTNLLSVRCVQHCVPKAGAESFFAPAIFYLYDGIMLGYENFL
jgi:hypothetical protein